MLMVGHTKNCPELSGTVRTT